MEGEREEAESVESRGKAAVRRAAAGPTDRRVPRLMLRNRPAELDPHGPQNGLGQSPAGTAPSLTRQPSQPDPL